ncbi:MAG: hypothetical protein M3336_11610 [Chloroflexota bacterium]|nr:hypothetical protein [Chloroflexota bacterium]
MRIVIQVASQGEQSPDLPEQVRGVLEAAGECQVWMPHPDVLPGLYVATIPPGADGQQLVDRLRSLSVVRDAELDRTREAS